MAIALAETVERGGKLVRYAGGYWTVAGTPYNGQHPAWYIGASTIQALERRGHVTYTQWQESRRPALRKFPVACEARP